MNPSTKQIVWLDFFFITQETDKHTEQRIVTSTLPSFIRYVVHPQGLLDEEWYSCSSCDNQHRMQYSTLDAESHVKRPSKKNAIYWSKVHTNTDNIYNLQNKFEVLIKLDKRGQQCCVKKYEWSNENKWVQPLLLYWCVAGEMEEMCMLC